MYLAMRVIRTSSELWDDEPVAEQAQIIGRHPDGRWLDGTSAHGAPDYAEDPFGDRTPLDSHVRRANPRDGSPAPPLLRRSWSYAAGTAPGGSPDEGVLFMSYQADIGRGFEAVQRRRAAQRLDDYILTVGGGYFVVPPPGTTWERSLTG
jgi:Dyp-type peroxidase family